MTRIVAESTRACPKSFTEGFDRSSTRVASRRQKSRQIRGSLHINSVPESNSRRPVDRTCLSDWKRNSYKAQESKNYGRPRAGFSPYHAICIAFMIGSMSFCGRERNASALVQDSAGTRGAHTLGVIVPSIHGESIFKDASWKQVLDHMNTRLSWEDTDLSLQIYDAESLESLESSLDGVMVLDVHDVEMANQILDATNGFESFIAVKSNELLENANRIKGSRIGLAEKILAFFSKEREERLSASKVIEELVDRASSDDFFYSFLVYFNVASRPIDSVVNSTKRSDAGLQELGCMLTKCPKEIFSCVTDPTCKTALDCLDSCAFNDQVCSYRCIASYESPQLQEFSLCILQKHNCLGLDASIPDKPPVVPMKSFRGQTMTHEIAEQLFTGWLDDAKSSLDLPERESYSWRVFAGKNAAYDKFPCQYQLFFPGKARNSFWYRPIFKVETLDGKVVWRERLYRVKQHKADMSHGAPMFRLSVLDNGVTSLEDWAIIDCDENHLSWCIFAYSGAASRAGLSYSGAILTSRDGQWPTETDTLRRIQGSLDANGIKMWELTNVDNSNCQDFSTVL
jgi:hypothetical protein